MDIDYWLLATIGCSSYSQIDPSSFLPAEANHFAGQTMHCNGLFWGEMFLNKFSDFDFFTVIGPKSTLCPHRRLVQVGVNLSWERVCRGVEDYYVTN